MRGVSRGDPGLASCRSCQPRFQFEQLPAVEMTLPLCCLKPCERHSFALKWASPAMPPALTPRWALLLPPLRLQLVQQVTELVISELLWLNYANPEKPIYVYINSTGAVLAALRQVLQVVGSCPFAQTLPACKQASAS